LLWWFSLRLRTISLEDRITDLRKEHEARRGNLRRILGRKGSFSSTDTNGSEMISVPNMGIKQACGALFGRAIHIQTFLEDSTRVLIMKGGRKRC
jgi:hypothetical protein